jgi:hypothetical protein
MSAEKRPLEAVWRVLKQNPVLKGVWLLVKIIVLILAILLAGAIELYRWSHAGPYR